MSPCWLISTATTGFVLACAHWPPAAAEDAATTGRKLAELHCARCHVIDHEQLLAGIGSTPSFPLLLSLPEGEARFETFFARRPHPVHVRIAGLPAPDPLTRPSNAAPFELSLEDVAAILAYARTLRAP